MNSRSNNSNSLVVEGYTYPSLLSLVIVTLKAGISVLLRGHPGVGKSSLAAEIARQLKLPLIDIRLAQRDPVELCGVHYPDKKKETLKLLPPEWVVKACKEPCLIVLDEINSAITKLHQSIAYQIVLERRVGEFKFHEGTMVIGAGNLEEDKAIVTKLSSALCNRFAHFIMRPDVDSWLEWGVANNIDAAILAYIANSGIDSLYNNDGSHSFPSPRTWEMASRVFKLAEPHDRKRAVASCVGVAEAERFFSYLRLYGKVDARKIVYDGQKISFNTAEKAEPSFIYAAVFAVASFVSLGQPFNENELGNIVKFLNSPGLNAEFKMLFLKHVNQRSDLVSNLKPLPEFHKIATELVNLNAEVYCNKSGLGA